MNFPTNWRDRRNFLAPPHYSFASYGTDTKSEMRTTFGDELFLNNLYFGPDPLRKNLADTIITEENMATKNGKIKLETPKEVEKGKPMQELHEENSTLSGITSFFSGVLNVISNAMFSKRKPADFSADSSPEMAVSSMWHGAKFSDENKILQDENLDDMSSEFFTSDMTDCRAAAAHCKSKLDQVRVLLSSSKPVPCNLRVRRRPKKVFVEPGSVEESFEDAFSPEDFENIANDSYIEYSSPVCYHEHVFGEIDGAKVKVEAKVVPKVAPEAPTVVNEPSKVVPKTVTVVENPPEIEKQEMVLETPKIVTKTPLNAEMSKLNTETLKTVTELPKLSSEAPKMVPETPKELPETPLVCETTEIVKNVPEVNIIDKLEPEKKQIIESCEDKITKLKLLLQERRKKPKVVVEPLPETGKQTDKPPEGVKQPDNSPEVVKQPDTVKTSEIPMLTPLTLPKLETETQPLVTLPPRPKTSNKVKDKRFKNPNRCPDKRRKSRMRKNIHEDMQFANELNSEDLSSNENSPSTTNLEHYVKNLPTTTENKSQSQPKQIPQKEYFDEVSGKFHPASVESEDSFQIVFNDSPKFRRSSDCDSEDSFIIFEDSPDSCYTSNDVFGDTSDSDEYDSDSDVSDSGCGFKLSASLSKSVSNLADDSLYEEHSEDEVDCANVTVCESVPGEIGEVGASKGMLIDERKKLLRKDLPAKRVHFSADPPKVHVMRVWLFAARQTRQRYWEQFVSDRDRFKRRIADVDMAVSWVLKPQHRSRVMFQRFMPWWNAQRRKELAEKKEREAQKKIEEEERKRLEEIEIERQEKENLEKEDADSSLATDNDVVDVKDDVTRVDAENTDVAKENNTKTDGVEAKTIDSKTLNKKVDVPEANKVVVDTKNCENNTQNVTNEKISVPTPNTDLNKKLITTNTKSDDKNHKKVSAPTNNKHLNKKCLMKLNKSIKELNEKNKNGKVEDSNKKMCEKQILARNDKLTELKTDYSSGILKT